MPTTQHSNSAPARRPWERPPSTAFAPPTPDRDQHTPPLPAPSTATDSAADSAPDHPSATESASAADLPTATTPARTPAPPRPATTPPPAGLIRPRSSRRRTRGLLIAVTAFAVVVIASVAAGAWAIDSMSSTSADSGPDAPAAIDNAVAPVSQPPVADPDDPCPETTTAHVTTGDDEGGLVGGAEVIKRFNYAYYVWRSGTRAREVVAPDTHQVGSAADLDGAISSIPAGTTFCLSITDRGHGLWAVQLAHNTPNPADRALWYQLVQTVDDHGRTWIVSINDDIRKGQ